MKRAIALQPPRTDDRSPADRAARGIVAGMVERRLLELEAAGKMERVTTGGITRWRRKDGTQ
jgi:hypothetical protein